MAAKLQCEICGGKLIGKPGGIFECENCGTEYSTEWAKAKIQEITGTVKVEGTVEVTGKVQIDGPVKVEGGANKEALLQRGMMALERKQWKEAENYLNQALNYDAKYGEAYLGLAMAKAQCQSLELYKERYLSLESRLRLQNSDDLRYARRFDKYIDAVFSDLDEKGRIIDENTKLTREKALNPARERLAGLSGKISAGYFYSVAVTLDGTVLAAGKDEKCVTDVKDWNNISYIAAGRSHTVGLKSDGTVFAVGSNQYGQCNVSEWRDVVSVAAGFDCTVGLRADGTVVATGNNACGQLDVSGWKQITAIATFEGSTVGLRADGSVIAIGNNRCGQCNVQEWRDIISVAVGGDCIFGLKADGKVVVAGDGHYFGNSFVTDWENVVAIAASTYHTVGLLSDGSVIATRYFGDFRSYNGQCEVSDWADVVAISASTSHTVGLTADGRVVSAGTKVNNRGQCDTDGWKLFQSIDTIGEEIKAASERRKEKIAALNAENASLQAELQNLKGLFSGGKRKQVESRLAEIEAELKKLG